MQTREASNFLPPAPGAGGRSMFLSVLVHGLLVLALTWGLNWNRHEVAVPIAAEVWSAIPAPAAPQANSEPEPQPEPKPEPPPEPQPEPKPEPKPQPKPVPPPPPPPKASAKAEAAKEAEIATAKQRIKEQEKARQAEAERAAAKRKAELDRKEAEHQAKVKKLEEERQRKAEQETKKREEAQKRKDQEAKTKREEQAKRDAQAKREAEESRRMEEQRKANLARLNQMAGNSPNPDSTGTQAKASGPSDSWGGRIQEAVLPRITFTEDKPPNIVATVRVKLAPDGTIVGKDLIKTSGNKAWDDAVLRALEKTGKLPRDIDGRIHTPVDIDFNPRSLQR